MGAVILKSLERLFSFFLLQHTTQVAVASIQPITPHHQNSTYLLPIQLLFTCPPLTHALPKYKYRPFFSLPVFGDHMKTCLSQFIDGTLKRQQEWILIAHPLLSPHFSKRHGPLLLSNPHWSRWEAASRLWNAQQDLSQISLFSCH